MILRLQGQRFDIYESFFLAELFECGGGVGDFVGGGVCSRCAAEEYAGETGVAGVVGGVCGEIPGKRNFKGMADEPAKGRGGAAGVLRDVGLGDEAAGADVVDYAGGGVGVCGDWRGGGGEVD